MSSEPIVTAFAPASVSNLACGFDVLGLALTEPGDRVTARRHPRPGLHLSGISGDGGLLPREPERNTATVAVQALLDALPEPPDALGPGGLELELVKGLPLASGLGGSAASAVAAVVAVDALLELHLSTATLLEAALEGERSACGARHPDNVVPCLLGGFVLTRSVEPLDPVRLQVPDELWLGLIHPAVEVPTREARDRLPRTLPLATAVRQGANLGALVAALHQGDWELLSRSLVDEIAEPVRRDLVPGYDAMKRAALDAGAAGANLSGSGPTVFALCRGETTARRAAEAMGAAFRNDTGLACRTWTSPVSPDGARRVETAP